MLLVALLLVACDPEPPSGDQPVPPFLWGAATSSYQVEGGIDCSEPSVPCNDYDFFNSNKTIHDTVAFNTGKAGPALNLAPAGRALDFWDPAIYKQDFERAQLLGLNAFRISLEWARIEPERDVFDQDAIDHYKAMIGEMRERGLEPVVSLNHFTLPIWALRPPSDQECRVLFCFPTDGESGYRDSLQGWVNDETVAEWVEFVRRVVPEFSSSVDYWLTINEPMGSQVALGYVAGIWSPGFLSDGGKAKRVIHNLIEAHVQAYDVIKSCEVEAAACDNVDAGDDGTGAASVGFAHAMGPTVPAPPGFGGSAGLNAEAYKAEFIWTQTIAGRSGTI